MNITRINLLSGTTNNTGMLTTKDTSKPETFLSTQKNEISVNAVTTDPIKQLGEFDIRNSLKPATSMGSSMPELTKKATVQKLNHDFNDISKQIDESSDNEDIINKAMNDLARLIEKNIKKLTEDKPLLERIESLLKTQTDKYIYCQTVLGKQPLEKAGREFYVFVRIKK